MATTHIATIGTAADVVAADNYDLTIYRAKAEYVGEDDVEFVADGDSVRDSDLTVPLSGDVEEAIAEADQLLDKQGFVRLSPWAEGDNALYAQVEASIEDRFTELVPLAAQIEMLISRRHMLVQSLMMEPSSAAPRKRIAQAARLSEPRLYQIRDDR